MVPSPRVSHNNFFAFLTASGFRVISPSTVIRITGNVVTDVKISDTENPLITYFTIHMPIANANTKVHPAGVHWAFEFHVEKIGPSKASRFI